MLKAYEAEHDDYRAIVAKALADRLAEAFAESLHEQVRREWYVPDEELSSEELIKERYRGDQTGVWLPGVPRPQRETGPCSSSSMPSEAAGIDLTTSCAMLPAASVSGLYLQHPAARYFHVGRPRDQVEDYARRKGESLMEAERWLAPELRPRAGLGPFDSHRTPASLLVASPP